MSDSFGWVDCLAIEDLQRMIKVLQHEVYRLKRGDFTEDEFQNLCHKFGEDDAVRHWRGCHEYHRHLFGKEPPF